MGLDMYLSGRKYLPDRWDLEEAAREAATRKEDGCRIEEVVLKLGYWRKHSHLHGFIVTTFAEGRDECQKIPLSKESLKSIIAAVEKGTLPETSGFFFGNSSLNGWMGPDGVKETVDMLTKALKWLEDQPAQGEWRSVEYQASW